MGILAALYVLEISGAVAALALHRYYNRLDALTIRQMVLVFVPLVIVLVSGTYLAGSYLKSRRSDARQFLLPLLTNLLAIALIVVASEALVRLFSVRTPLGVSFAGTLLLPKSWDQVRARNADVLKRAPSNISYFVSDPLLGWTLGRDRRSKDGLYFSSAEGIRSPRAGVEYKGHAARHRIAIVGDSFAFGLEVPFHDSWGARLESALGTESVVLNFGVDGYGLDQAYLRYERDVRPWHPDVTIFGFIEHDLLRTMGVYPFITFPDWGFPFSKPRFVVGSGKLELLNTHLENPSEIIAEPSVAALPFVTYDLGYIADEWKWRPYHASQLLRFILSRYSRWPTPRPEVSDESVTQLNRQLLVNFTRSATAENTIPLVAYFPSRGDFTGLDRSARDSLLSSLRQSGAAYIDLTSCLAALGLDRAFIPGRPHYSAEGNAAVASCLLPAVRGALESG